MKDLLKERTHKTESQMIFIPQVCEKVYEQEIIDDHLVKKYHDSFNLVFTGNISPAQSFETVIACAKKLQEDEIHDLCWVIVGDGMSRTWLENLVKQENLNDCFYFEGFVPVNDIPKYTNIADAFFGCLSKSSFLDCTIPAKVFSYFAAGKPLRLAMDGEIQDIVRQANVGFVSNAEDSEGFYQNVKLLYYMSKKQRAEIGKNAKQYHFQHFERNKNFAKMMEFIES
jgi:glycosyltransferase involved in cell wall biosynthesis